MKRRSNELLVRGALIGSLLIGGTLIGCDDASKQRPSTASHTTSTADSAAPSDGGSAKAPNAALAPLGACNRASLQRELDGYCEVGTSAGPPGVAPLPWPVSPGRRPVSAVEIYMVRDDQLNVDGGITNVNALPEVWRRKRDLHSRVNRVKTTPWLLAVGSKVNVDRVVAVMKVLAEAGDLRGHLVFSAPTAAGDADQAKPRDPARLKKLHDKIDNEDPNQKAMLLAKEIQSSKITTCKPLMKVFGALAGVHATRKCEMLAVGIAEGFPSCKCEHADEILTLMYAVMADTEPPAQRGAWVATTLSPDADPIVLPEGTPWSEVLASLPHDRLNTLHFEVKP